MFSYSIDIRELKRAMVDADIGNITQLSEKSGIDRNTLATTLNGSRFPSSTVMQRLAIALNLDYARAGKIFFAPQLTPNASEELV